MSDIEIKDKETTRVELIYPEGTHAQHVEIGLMHVRASDGIRVTYDFERDGWIVEQPTKLCWANEDRACDCGWKEVAFIKSWQLSAEQEANDRLVKGES